MSKVWVCNTGYLYPAVIYLKATWDMFGITLGFIHRASGLIPMSPGFIPTPLLSLVLYLGFNPSGVYSQCTCSLVRPSGVDSMVTPVAGGVWVPMDSGARGEVRFRGRAGKGGEARRESHMSVIEIQGSRVCILWVFVLS